MLIPSEYVRGYTLEEEERALDKDVPHHGRAESSAIEPEDLRGEIC